jgi:hypothetical protein
MQAHAGHVSATMAESATAEMSTIVAVGNNHEESEEGVRELQRSGFACDLIEFGQMAKDSGSGESDRHVDLAFTIGS